jgi:hypothetical protein
MDVASLESGLGEHFADGRAKSCVIVGHHQFRRRSRAVISPRSMPRSVTARISSARHLQSDEIALVALEPFRRVWFLGERGVDLIG